MSYLYPVTVHPEILEEFIYFLEQNHQTIEHLVIDLERTPNNLSKVKEIRDYFSELMFSATKLDLIPISESIADTITALDLLLQFKLYPPRMSEFILLVVDRVLLLARDIERQESIDIRKSQHILVALQHIILLKDPAPLEAGIRDAISAIVQEIKEGEVHSTNSIEDDIMLFDEIELFADDAEPQRAPPTDKLNILVPNQIYNPILQARDYIAAYLDSNPSAKMLSTISDLSVPHGIAHTRFLLELTLAMNQLAGNPVDCEGLMLGVCVHDLALCAIPNIINKKTRLTDEEFSEIRKHPVTAAELVATLDGSSTAREVVMHHHERTDGKGYPLGLNGNQTSDGGKLLAIVDSFHGMIESRPYKKYPRSMVRAIAEINACIDTQFDNYWVKIFNQCMRQYWMPMYREVYKKSA